MNVDSMPCQQLFNEETQYSEDSVYLTPETSLTGSLFHKLYDCKSFDTLDWIPKKVDSYIETRFEHNVSRRIQYGSDFSLEKENVASSTELTRRRRKSSGARTPLKCMASLSNSIDKNQSSVETLRSNKENDTSELHAKTAVVPQLKKLSERNIPGSKSTRCNVLRRMKLLQNLKSKYRNRTENNVSSNSEDVLIRTPKPNYGSISHASQEVQKSNSSPLQKSDHDQPSSQSSVLPVFMKFRFVQLKRLFRRSVTSLRSCYKKCAQNMANMRKKDYQSLKRTNGGLIHDITNASENFDFENLALQSKLCNMQELLTTVISKLSYVENELKELKNAVKENNTGRSMFVPPPPPIPPPPPPLPSNFIVCSSTPKRKADVTTPENQQLAKRPVRIPEQKAQFSITVEELRNVKLRKTGNSVVKKINVEKNSTSESTPFTPSGRLGGFRFKRNRTVEKDLSEIAAEVLSPREKDIASGTRSICSPTPSIDRLANQTIFEQTPKRTKRENSTVSRKRKESLDKSPARKRLNSGGL